MKPFEKDEEENMMSITNQAGLAGWNSTFAYIAIAAMAVSSLALLTLHFMSPEFSPSWRMVSEYANGQWRWLLTLVFFGCAIGSFVLAAALWPVSTNIWGKIGLVFLVLGGIGQLMGGLFDINHKLHGPAAMIGIPSICIAAVLLTIALRRTPGIVAPPIWSAQLPWISVALIAIGFMLFFSALKAAGVDMAGRTEPLKELPDGVSSFVGWANRLFFVANYLWVVMTSLAIIRASSYETGV
ncbi:MAG: DUF998 domain-containing protein [Sphingorhabdus sp.]|uniref:DUF998 domain-containing protein n=1 Tax=Sphingorhabdus sp. TaxID=1902408 RepID=UPI003C843864